MKVFEILDKELNLDMMVKLLKKHGFVVRWALKRNKSIFHIDNLKGQYTGRVWFDDAKDQWGYDITGGQGHIVVKSKYGSEADVIALMKSYLPTVAESQEDDDEIPLVWKLAHQLRDRGQRVSVMALFPGQNPEFLQGEVILVDLKRHRVEIYAHRLNYVHYFKTTDDDNFTLQKDRNASFYWVRNTAAALDESQKKPSAPLIWRAIKHATEVENKVVRSDIVGGEGEWTIRYAPGRRPVVGDEQYYYVHVADVEADGHKTENWFEILPEDDEKLEIIPVDDGYEVRVQSGETFSL